MNGSSGFGYMGASPMLDPNSDCVGFEGSGSRDLPIVGGVQDSGFPGKEAFCPLDRMEQTTDLAETFYSKARGVDLVDTAVFPKVCI
jgi:hypothetical protein